MDNNQNEFSYEPHGRIDAEGFKWHRVYSNSKPVMQQGVHLSYKALDVQHASAMHQQIIGINARLNKQQHA